MKKILSLLFTVACLCACAPKQTVVVTVTNPLDLNRSGEMVELSMETITDRLGLADTDQVIVLDADGEQVPYQITYNDQLIFPAKVDSKATATYTIQAGTPKEVAVVACGRQYPERLDDLAWENDLIGSRAYGPALQQSGQRGFGYDIFLKRGTTAPILEELYDNQVNKNISYHHDHGNGMDCYAVGPTLGAGVAALVADEAIVYPWCYKEYEILDNGPLRFTARLTFHPLTVKADTAVIETRVITLDAGSQLNRTAVSYANLSQTTPIVTGIVLHEPDGEFRINADQGYMTYLDPTQGPDNGKLFMGCAFPTNLDKAENVMFSPEEKRARGNADGHILAFSNYEPETEYTYYWGFAWDRAGLIKSSQDWDAYMAAFAQKVRNPLQVTM